MIKGCPWTEDNNERMDCLIFQQVCMFHLLHHYNSLSKPLSESDEQVLAEKCSFENKTGPNSPELDPHVVLTSEPQSPHLYSGNDNNTYLAGCHEHCERVSGTCVYLLLSSFAVPAPLQGYKSPYIPSYSSRIFSHLNNDYQYPPVVVIFGMNEIILISTLCAGPIYHQLLVLPTTLRVKLLIGSRPGLFLLSRYFLYTDPLPHPFPLCSLLLNVFFQWLTFLYDE